MHRQRVAVVVVGVVLGVVTMLAGSGCREHTSIREVRVGYGFPVLTLDPHGHDETGTRAILFSIFESLTFLDPGLEVRPGLAERWTTPDPRVWVLRLREGVLFHDGRTLRPEDVVASLERAWKSEGSEVGSYLSMVESFSIGEEDPSEIVIRTIEPAPMFLSRLALIPIVPADFDPQHPVGTGPYRVMGPDPEGGLVLERWDRYWGRSGLFERIRILDGVTGDRLHELVASEGIDVVSSISASFLDTVPERSRWRVVQTAGLGTGTLGLNVGVWPTSDPRVREAIDLAIDRKRLVEEVVPEGDGSRAVSLVPPEVFGFSRAGTVPPADPARARELLREAGAVGSRITVDVYNLSEAIARFLLDSLEAVGLAPRIVEHEWDEYLDRVMGQRSVAHVIGWDFPLADATDFFVVAIHSRDPSSGLGLQNTTGYSDPEMDRWIDELFHETRTQRRLDLIGKILGRLARDRPLLPLYHRKHLILVREPFDVPERLGYWVLPQEISLRR